MGPFVFDADPTGINFSSVSVHVGVTWLSAQYLMNQLEDSYQIYKDISLGLYDELLGFVDLDLTFKITARLRLSNFSSSTLKLQNWFKDIWFL